MDEADADAGPVDAETVEDKAGHAGDEFDLDRARNSLLETSAVATKAEEDGLQKAFEIGETIIRNVAQADAPETFAHAECRENYTKTLLHRLRVAAAVLNTTVTCNEVAGAKAEEELGEPAGDEEKEAERVAMDAHAEAEAAEETRHRGSGTVQSKTSLQRAAAGTMNLEALLLKQKEALRGHVWELKAIAKNIQLRFCSLEYLACRPGNTAPHFPKKCKQRADETGSSSKPSTFPDSGNGLGSSSKSSTFPDPGNGLGSSSKSATTHDSGSGIARAVQEARSSLSPAVEDDEAMLKAILVEGETASMPVRDANLLVTVNAMTAILKGIVLLASAEEVAAKHAQIKKWCETMGQLTSSITKAKDDLKRHLSQCERAKKAQEKKQKEAEEKKAVDETNRQAKQAAEKLLESKEALAKPCIFSLSRYRPPGVHHHHWITKEPHTTVEKFKGEQSKCLKVLMHETVKALSANATIQKQLTVFAATHKKHKDFARSQIVCTQMLAKQ
eukprot:2481206-Amphidinium_carterae.1